MKRAEQMIFSTEKRRRKNNLKKELSKKKTHVYERAAY